MSIDQFSVTVKGRSETIILVHRGFQHRDGGKDQGIIIAPDSGTGEIAASRATSPSPLCRASIARISPIHRNARTLLLFSAIENIFLCAEGKVWSNFSRALSPSATDRPKTVNRFRPARCRWHVAPSCGLPSSWGSAAGQARAWRRHCRPRTS